MRRVAYLPCFLVLLLALAGCKQNEGDRCNLDSDCAEGLQCCVQLDNASTFREGRCAAKCESTKPDTGVPDLGNTDAKTDAKTSDAKTNEAAPLDLPAPDKALPDTKPTPDQPVPDKTPTPDTKPGQDTTPSPDTKQTTDTQAAG